MIVSAGWLFVQKNKPATQSPTLVYANDTEIRTLEHDTDNDGLKDWEESLWKTDPKNADTDGDGVTDGTEVDENRDPAVSGPGTRKLQPATTTPENQAEISATDGFSRELFSQYAALRQSGNLTTESTNDLVASIVADAEAKATEKTRIYTTADVLTTTNSSREAVLAYRDRLNTTIGAYSYAQLGDEMTVLNEIITAGDPARMGELAKAEKAYRAILRDLKKLPAPETLAVLHASFLTTFEGLAESTQGMQAALSDPLVAVVAINTFQAHAKQLVINFNTQI